MSYTEKLWIDKIRAVAIDRNEPWSNRKIKIIEIRPDSILFGVSCVHRRFFTSIEFLITNLGRCKRFKNEPINLD